MNKLDGGEFVFLYILTHVNVYPSGYIDTKMIGCYTSYSRVVDKIEKYKKLPGFCDVPDGFHIELLDFEEFSGELYSISYSHETDDTETEIICGYYPSIEKARETYDRLVCKRPYSDAPEDLLLEKEWIDREFWTDGYVHVE